MVPPIRCHAGIRNPSSHFIICVPGVRADLLLPLVLFSSVPPGMASGSRWLSSSTVTIGIVGMPVGCLTGPASWAHRSSVTPAPTHSHVLSGRSGSLAVLP